MRVWEVDFYRRPLQDEAGQPLWELLICDATTDFAYTAVCPQAQAGVDWLVAQLRQLLTQQPAPDCIQVFRSQTFNLLTPACQTLEIPVEPTRRTPKLKQWLQQRSQQYATWPNYTGQPYNPLERDQPPPVPLPENLWGDRWRFAALPAGALIEAFRDRPIPVLEMPPALQPFQLGLASTVPIPGVVIDGGRQSMRLVRWLQAACPVSLTAIPGAPDGLILEAGLVDRWIVATFEDAEVKVAAVEYERRKQASRGLHFLLVQPDDSGMTYTGFWLLKPED